MKTIAFATPDIDESSGSHPQAHQSLRMFFECVGELPDSAWAEIVNDSEQTPAGQALRTSKIGRCKTQGLFLEIETVKSLTNARPYSDAHWIERATFFDQAGPGQAPLARLEIIGEGKLNPDAQGPAAMARSSVSLNICAFDAQGNPAQMTPEHWAMSLDLLDLEGSFGEALESLRDASERLFDSFASRVRKARSALAVARAANVHSLDASAERPLLEDASS